LSDSSIAHDGAHRIKQASGYQSRPVASAIEEDFAEAIDAGKLASAEVVAIVGASEFAEFERLAVVRQ
jgi:hypothetical protein